MLFHNYKQRVLSVGRGNLIGYWPMDEHAGGVAADASLESNNGAYAGVVLNNTVGPDGRGAPRFDGVNDYNNIYSAGFNADFDGDHGTVMIWCKVFNAGFWTDGAVRAAIRFLADGNNKFVVAKTTVNNEYKLGRRAGGVWQDYLGVSSSVDWFSMGLTWDKTADEIKFYFDGILKSTQNTLSNFVGALGSTTTVIGENATVPTAPWNGWLAHGSVWKTALTETEVGILGKI